MCNSVLQREQALRACCDDLVHECSRDQARITEQDWRETDTVCRGIAEVLCREVAHEVVPPVAMETIEEEVFLRDCIARIVDLYLTLVITECLRGTWLIP